ncbi:hypothetical protein ABB37_09203 [Leptomonas pyrrhocoris]|uniref:Uncharacterized protein n=1 Tax=Leptomonas pyrrhocoris TaxID=157538 RepID=A0A0N0DRI9_LEPPY|nr:hypothetical protein ABB37_09203 [Leptomonas pyrrhocoris]KPA74564.1 hypothetical protein ABB37_09203 [Leptomonas pyrrhocoris]|eukprot:XP_015653003.1 hypothetical protein ABB37_09203 [Leptomonas pyrrhocoris]
MISPTFKVQQVQTGVFIYPPDKDGDETLSVSGTQQVTLHCAGDLSSEPFPFDTVVHAPFYTTLYAMCVADNVRAQFGAAVRRPAAACTSAPRRSTVLHGDPASHVAKAFYQVVRLAAEDVVRLCGAQHAGSPCECVFNAARVYPWGEEDPLGEALRVGAATSPLLQQKTTVPLQTPAQQRLFATVLKQLCSLPPDAERGEASACVRQVRLAVYTCGGGDAAVAGRVLCAEHLFSLVPSICDVCTSFGTTMEALCEVLVCRREGNLLDNPLLPVLLPGVAIEGLSVLTCISAKGRYASRPCIDACCFGCNGAPSARSSTMHAGSTAKHTLSPDKPSVDRSRTLLTPPFINPLTSSFQRMTEELLTSVGPQKAQPPSAAPHTSSPAQTPLQRGPAGSVTSNGTSSPFWRRRVEESLFVRLHEPPEVSPDCRTHAAPSTTPSLISHSANTPDTPQPKSAEPIQRPMASASPVSDAITETAASSVEQLQRAQERVARPNDESLLDRVTVAEGRAEAAVQAAREREVEALEQLRAMEEKMSEMRSAYTTQEASLLIRQRMLQQSCTELETQEQRLLAAAEERRCAADELERAARQRAVLELRYGDCVREACREYACAVAAKIAVLDAHTHSLADEACLDAWSTHLSQLQRQSKEAEERLEEVVKQSGAELRRVVDLHREEDDLKRAVDALRSDCAQVQCSIHQLERAREEQQQRIDAEVREAAATQETALRDYDESVAVLRRLRTDQQGLRKRLEELDADCQQQQSRRDEARKELADVRAVLAELRSAHARAEKKNLRKMETLNAEVDDTTHKLDALRSRAADEEERLRAAAEEYDAHRAAEALEAFARAQAEEHDCVARAEQDARDAVCAEQAAALQQAVADLAARMADTAGQVAADATAQQRALQAELERLRGEREAVADELAALTSQQAHLKDGEEKCSFFNATGIVVDELRKTVEELADATDELGEVEDALIEETERALLTFRRCDGELTLRVERLLDRCASFMDVESRIVSRASSAFPSPSIHSRRTAPRSSN